MTCWHRWAEEGGIYCSVWVIFMVELLCSDWVDIEAKEECSSCACRPCAFLTSACVCMSKSMQHVVKLVHACIS